MRPPPLPRRAVAAGALIAALLAAGEAAAQRSDAEVAARIAFVQDRLVRRERAASLWWHLWYAGYLSLTVGQGILAGAVKDPGFRADMAVGAVASSLGVGVLGVFDFPARDAGSAARALPEGTPAERRHKLAAVETLLRRSAEAEALGRSWLPHVGGVAVAALSGVVLGVAYKRGWNALTTVAGSIAITELQIWTQPTAAIDDWKAYQAGAFGGPAPPERTGAISWTVAVVPGGVGVIGRF